MNKYQAILNIVILELLMITSIGIYLLEQKLIKQENLTDISLGIDLAICSNGQVFKNINKTIKVRKLEKRLKQKQRQISRKYEMNKIKKKEVYVVNLLKLKIQKNQRIQQN